MFVVCKSLGCQTVLRTKRHKVLHQSSEQADKAPEKHPGKAFLNNLRVFRSTFEGKWEQKTESID
uniref:Uncharacterized protein n=1 Tax=Anguilla anguilla TaxID=7936 RepID=A0A0E9RU38_ANGAN